MRIYPRLRGADTLVNIVMRLFGILIDTAVTSVLLCITCAAVLWLYGFVISMLPYKLIIGISVCSLLIMTVYNIIKY